MDMRIAILYFGGVCHYSNLLIGAILKLPISVLAFCPKSQETALRELTGEDSRIRFYDKPRLRSLGNLRALRQIVDEIEAFRPDSVHLLDFDPWLFWYGDVLSRYRLIATVHDPRVHLGDVASWKSSLGRNRFYRNVRQFIVLSQKMQQELSRHLEVSERRISVVRHGSFGAYARGARGQCEGGSNSVLFFGRLFKYKGLEYLIEAAPYIASAIPDVRFIIAGTGSRNYITSLKRKIAAHQSFVFHEEHVTDEKMSALFREASVVVLPYIEGTQSGVLMMAYAHGKPVIATNVGGFPEYVEDRRSGFIVPPGDARILAERTKEILLDKAMAGDMGRRGLEKSRQEFSWARIGREVFDVYSAAMNEGGV